MTAGSTTTHHHPARPLGDGPGALARCGPQSRAVLSALVALVLVGCSATVAPANVPPSGQIWFGTAYDPQSFALAGQTTSFPVGQQVAMVANLTKAGAGAVTIYLTGVGGQQIPFGSGDMTSNEGVLADLLGASSALPAGNYPVRVEDSGGNVLASGSFTVTP